MPVAFRQGLAAQGVSAAGETKVRNGACASSRIQGGYAPDFASAQRLSRIALLSALALILSYVETMIPLPTALPGVKLGLANVAVVVALFCFDTKTAAAVSVVKVLAAGFLFGSPVMLAYSLGGTVLAFASAALLAKVPGISVVVVSMASAILHNMGQIAVACFMLGTPAILISLPPLAVAACITGALTGCVAASVVPGRVPGGTGLFGALRNGSDNVSRGLASFGAKTQVGQAKNINKGKESQARGSGFGVYCAGSTFAHKLDARIKILFVVLFFITAFAAHDIAGLALVGVATVLSLASARFSARNALRTLRPFVWLIVLVVAMDVLFNGSGAVLACAGPFAITQGGLAFAAESVTRFCCLMLGTAALMRTTSPTDLTEGVRSLLHPLAKLGLHVDNLALALGMTFRFIPLFQTEFARLKAAQQARGANFSGGVVARLGAYLSVFTPLFSSAFRRADAVAFAVQSRAFGAGSRSSLKEHRMRKAETLVLCVSVIVLCLVLVL